MNNTKQKIPSCDRIFVLEEPNGLDATSESLILSGFARFHPFCSKHTNKTNNLDALHPNAVVPRVCEGYYNEKQSLWRLDTKIRFIRIKTVR